MFHHEAADDEDTPIEPVEIEVIQILYPGLAPTSQGRLAFLA